MRRLLMLMLLLSMSAAASFEMYAQAKVWATLTNGTLTLTYGAKPKTPAQVKCTGCGRTLSFSTNYCPDCGTKNPKDFTVYDAFAKVKPSEYADYLVMPWYEKSSEIKKVVFDPSMRQATNITSLQNFFYRLSYLTSITGLEYLNTSKVTDMSGMFDDCSRLSSIDLSHFNTASVTNMNRMFYYCKSLTSLDVSHFKTDKVTTMEYMFSNCESLTSLDLSHFNTANVSGTGLMNMFSGCKSLKTLDLSSFNTAKATYLGGMFCECRSLTSINVSSFNTARVEDFICMFEQCESLTTLDITSFDTRNAKMTAYMFRGCCRLKTIYVTGAKWVGLKVPNSGYYKPSLMSSDGTTLCNCYAQIVEK